MFLLNMAFISSSEVEKIYFMGEIKAKFNKKSFEFAFYYIQPFQQRNTFHFFNLSLFSGFVP